MDAFCFLFSCIAIAVLGAAVTAYRQRGPPG